MGSSPTWGTNSIVNGEIMSQGQYKKFKEGDKVKVLGTYHTSRTYGAGTVMQEMVGQVFKVGNKQRNKKDMVSLLGFYWDPRDLELAQAEKPNTYMKSNIKGLKFDPVELDV